MHPGVAERELLAWRLPALCARGLVQAALELLRAPFNFHSPCPHGCALPMVRGVASILPQFMVVPGPRPRLVAAA